MKSIAALFSISLFASASAQTDGSILVRGELQPVAQLDVKSAVGGRVKKLHVQHGDKVKAGDILVEIRTLPIDDKLSKISAPLDGTVLGVPLVVGQLVTPSDAETTTLMTIADTSKLLVETHLSQVDVSKLALKQLVRIDAEPSSGKRLEARISFIAPIATVKDGTKGFTVQALIEKPDSRLSPGMPVQLTIPASPRLSK